MISKMTLSNQSHFPRFFLSPESHLEGFCKGQPNGAITGDDCQFRLVVSRNWPGPGKSSSVIRWRRKVILLNLKRGFDEASCLKSSLKSLSRANLFHAPLVSLYHLKKNLKLAGHLVFNSRSNEYSLAPQFKCLEYTFKAEMQTTLVRGQ
jgi:hypothetical protein